MIRVGEFTAQVDEKRKQFWLETLSLKQKLQWVDFTSEQLADPVALLKTNLVEGVIVPTQISEQLIAASTKIPTEVREAGLVDAVVRLQSILWIRSYLRSALHQLIISHAPKLDTHSIVYVTGSDAQARMAAVVAIRMGFQKIVLISENFEEAQKIVGELAKNFFSLDLRVLRETELTLQPNNGSLLLNTLGSDTGGIVFEDLTYLNFLRKDGLVVDLPLGPTPQAAAQNPLLEEATHVGIRRLSGAEIWGLRDFLFLQELGAIQISASQYHTQWMTFLSEEKQT
jgi:shikimate 5-dehydrogenase